MMSETIQDALNNLADKYAQKLLEQVKAALAKPEFKNSGELANSVSVHVKKATATEAPIITLTYADQGFFIGYRNPRWTRLPDIDKLKKWAKTANIHLGDVPGYTYGTASKLSIEKQKERIVWAIAKNKRKEDTWKPKKWKKAAGLGELLKDLNAEALEHYTLEVERILAHSISTGEIMN